ncbi:MAG TPA: hypothetical protein VLD67_08675 [Vicinamibacterales bacterium]|nr:hypothetical protein [Vicinamibacterales bacterium]
MSPSRHLAAALIFSAFALVWSWPLARHLATHLAGEAPGDNVQFVWNLWWMRQALDSSDVRFFDTDRLFAPFGIDLTLHTHSALPSFVGATVLRALPEVPALNLTLLASLALNGFAAYLLALDRSKHRGASIVAGLVFSGSPYIAAHLLGHFNLVAAWGLPLFALFFLRSFDPRATVRRRAAVAAGLCLVATAYTDYYYLVYSAAFGAGTVLWRLRPATVAFRPRRLSRRARLTIAALLALVAAVVIMILVTGGFVAELGAVRISMMRITNPLTAAWLVAGSAVYLRVRPHLRFERPAPGAVGQHVRPLAPTVVVALAGLLPLIARGIALQVRGDYVTQRTSWASSPGGVDLATFVLGNPFHPWWGVWARRAYDWLDINRVEEIAWFGIVPAGVVIWAAWRAPHEPEIRRWLIVAGAFLLWALGPWLSIAGSNAGLPLPQGIMLWVPILSNARMPGRAIVMVYLAVAVLVAIVLARMPARARRVALPLAGLLVLADFLAAPFPVTPLERASMYDRLRSAPGPGSVLELPIGVRDGFGALGAFDDRTLWHQTIHERPMIGGFAARVPPSIGERYQHMPIIRSLLRLSAGQRAVDEDLKATRGEAARALQQAGVRFVVLNHRTAPQELARYAARLPLQVIEADEVRTLYTVEPPPPR